MALPTVRAKVSTAKAAMGLPRPSRAIASAATAEQHDPQAPNPVMMTSHFSIMSSWTCFLAGSPM